LGRRELKIDRRLSWKKRNDCLGREYWDQEDWERGNRRGIEEEKMGETEEWEGKVRRREERKDLKRI
jgi:nitric oxide synthase oxygenase domain/subunit